MAKNLPVSDYCLSTNRKFDRSMYRTNTFLDQVDIKEDDKNVFNIIENIFFIFFWNRKLKTSLNVHGFPPNQIIHF